MLLFYVQDIKQLKEFLQTKKNCKDITITKDYDVVTNNNLESTKILLLEIDNSMSFFDIYSTFCELDKKFPEKNILFVQQSKEIALLEAQSQMMDRVVNDDESFSLLKEFNDDELSKMKGGFVYNIQRQNQYQPLIKEKYNREQILYIVLENIRGVMQYQDEIDFGTLNIDVDNISTLYGKEEEFEYDKIIFDIVWKIVDNQENKTAEDLKKEIKNKLSKKYGFIKGEYVEELFHDSTNLINDLLEDKYMNKDDIEKTPDIKSSINNKEYSDDKIEGEIKFCNKENKMQPKKLDLDEVTNIKEESEIYKELSKYKHVGSINIEEKLQYGKNKQELQYKRMKEGKESFIDFSKK